MILVDTSVLLDLATQDKTWFAWSARQIAWFGSRDTLALNPVIYGELAVKCDSRADLDSRLAGWDIQPLDLDIAWRAAKAHANYRAQGGKRERILGDFWVGAHAEVKRLKLLTRNPDDFTTFSISHLICPGQNDAPRG